MRKNLKGLKSWDSKDMNLWIEHTKPIKLLRDIYSDPCPIVGHMNGDKVLIYLCGKIKKNLLKWFGSMHVSQDVVVSISEIIIEDYSELRLNEIDFFFKRLGQGTYGPVYNNLDLSTIVSKLKKYSEESGEVISEERDRKHRELKGSLARGDSQINWRSVNIDELSKNKMQEKISKTTKSSTS